MALKKCDRTRGGGEKGVLCGPVRALVFGGTNVVWTPRAHNTKTASAGAWRTTWPGQLTGL
jgi:hypothetical protein